MLAMPILMAFRYFVVLEHAVTITVHCLEHGDEVSVELIPAYAAVLIAVESFKSPCIMAQQLILAESVVLVGVKFQRVDLAVIAKPLVFGKTGSCREADYQSTENKKEMDDSSWPTDFFHGKSCLMRLEDAGDISNQRRKVDKGAVD